MFAPDLLVTGLLVTGLLVLAGCAQVPTVLDAPRTTSGNVPIVETSMARRNLTPLDPTLACYGARLQSAGRGGIKVAVGDIRDYTGKQEPEAGFTITQGGALMAYSGLGKMQPGIRLMERFDTRIADAELHYLGQRQLGDGQVHAVDDPATGGSASVPWMPYFGGTVLQSDYFVVGGITEVNYNIRSGGAEVAVNNLGPRARTYTMNVAVDLRIVGTQSLAVYDTVSIEKQVTGYEVGLGIFRFFGSDLFDVNIGAKSQEPLQLGVRTAIEAGLIELIETVTGVESRSCQPEALAARAQAQTARAQTAQASG